MDILQKQPTGIAALLDAGMDRAEGKVVLIFGAQVTGENRPSPVTLAKSFNVYGSVSPTVK